jgi:hypothetical protein
MRMLLLPCLLALGTAAQAQTPPAPQSAAIAPAPAFEIRAKELAALLSGSGSYDAFFSPGFKTKVPKEQFEPLSVRLRDANGPISGVRIKQLTTPYSGLVDVDYRDAVATLLLVVDPAAPHQVSGLRVNGLTARQENLDQVAAAFRALHGSSGLVFARLGGGPPELLVQHQADKPFAVGSAFKLVILAELVRATNAGERRWDDMVALDGSQLPGGGYVLKPRGTQVSLRELATQMISISDNSATDILLKTLGREKVEAMLPVLGVRDPARNRPFLSTLEAFKLKYLDNGSYGRRYAALDEPGRRALLKGDMARIPLIAISPEPPGGRKPTMIDQIEWFLTPADLVRIMDWLRRNSEGPRGADARAVLSKNPGIAPPTTAKWQWVGYKGGSEPGVMNMTLLLQAKNGDWYVLAGSWNDPARAVDEVRFASLIDRAAALAAP